MEHSKLVELDEVDLTKISGGRFGRLVKAGRILLEAAGFYDAIEDFKEGWSECG